MKTIENMITISINYNYPINKNSKFGFLKDLCYYEAQSTLHTRDSEHDTFFYYNFDKFRPFSCIFVWFPIPLNLRLSNSRLQC